jgi:hypothetical protein
MYLRCHYSFNREERYGITLPKSHRRDKNPIIDQKENEKGSNSIFPFCLRQILRSLTWQQNKVTAQVDV